MGWLHRFLRPHCEHCREIERERNQCASCDTLKEQLGVMTRERDRLLNKLIDTPEPVAPEVPQEIEPIVPKTIPWGARKVQLEYADREKAAALKLQLNKDKELKNQTTEELEEELGVSDGQG